MTNDFISQQKVKSNTTREERRGINSLKRRKDVVVFQTDKSSQFSVDSRDNYIDACRRHTENDVSIDEAENGRLI